MTRKLLGLLLLATVGCSGTIAARSDDGGVETSGEVKVVITSVPLDVGCVYIHDAAARPVGNYFKVSPGGGASLTMGNLPVGNNTFDAQAFDGGSCPPPLSAQPTWATQAPTSVDIQSGLITSLRLVLEQVGGANIGLQFGDGGVVDGG